MHSRRVKKMKLGQAGTQSTTAPDPNPTVPVLQDCLTSAVFGNDLVFDAIAGYLGTTDLKILRQTCKLLLGKINNHRTFTSKVQIPIMDESIEIGIVDQCTFEFQNARIALDSTSSKNLTSVLKRLTHVSDLKLFHSNGRDGAEGQTEQCENTIRACYNSIGQFSNLRALTLDLNLLSYSIYINPLKDCVSTIKELRIVGESLNSMPPLPNPVLVLTMSSKTQWKAYKQNMKKIGSLDWRLKSFVFKLKEEIPPGYHDAALNGILLSSALTLETIHADTTILKKPSPFTVSGLSGLNHLGNVHQIVFPSLKAVNLSIENESCPNRLASFLAKQPPLESIQLTIRILDKPYIILDAVEANCCSIPNPKLHTLEINGDGLVENLDHLLLWQFLKDLKELKNFKCVRGSLCMSWYNHGYDLLEYLPITLHSIEIGWHFGPYAVSLGGEFIFDRFPNLQVLKMIECGSTFLNNSLLQSMCSTLTGLRVLHFGHSEAITDIGLTGMGNESDGKTLTNLKGLQELAIVRCPNLTDEALVQSIQFLELKAVKLVCNLSDIAVVEIAKNNPSLELMAIGATSTPPQPFEFQVLCSGIAEVNPRIRRIIREYSLRGGPNLSSIEALRTPSSGTMRIGPLIARNRSILPQFPFN